MTFQIFTLQHRGMPCLGVRLPIQDPRNSQIRSIKGIRWSRTHTCWYGTETPELLAKLTEIGGEKPILKTISSSIQEEELNSHFNYNEDVEKMKLWMKSKRYSERTIKVYANAMLVFLHFFHDRNPSEIDENDVVIFNNEYLLKNNLSASYQNQVINAIKLFYRVTESRKINLEELHRPRREHHLPNVLSKEEVKALLDATKNLKHRSMLSLIYACGLRRGELIRLLPTDIDSSRGILIIRQSKGKKDRIVPLGSKIIDLLRAYFKDYRPQKWLFEGAQAGTPYGERSLQLVLKQACQRAGIKKDVTLHWLRHSYATHLHESGTDIRYIQELLGHNSSRTTEIYTHVSTRSLQNIRSPFDDL
jgi:integrase/recombinase XerD